MKFRWRFVAIGCFLFSICFAGYLYFVYQDLELSFIKPEGFSPTRIYSDVTRIAAPMRRNEVEQRLKSRGYSYKNDNSTLEFVLHKPEYPSYLITENHQIFDARALHVKLKFESEKTNAPLQQLELNGATIPDIFLEPELVATLSRGSTKEIRNLMRFENIPAFVWKAIIAIEDQHFLEHSGFDPRGIARALWVNLRTQSLAQGGSTITQQLVKNLTARRDKNILKKINELFLAFMLETKYSKEQILERYLNEVYLGQVGSLEVHGVAEGAKYFFGKRLEDLNLAEVALMAGLIKGPGYYSPYRHKDRAMERQRLVLKKMVETEQIAQDEADLALGMPVRIAPQVTQNKSPYFADFVKAELIRQLKDKVSEQELVAAGFNIYTTLDSVLNHAAQSAVAEGTSALEKRFKPGQGERIEGALAAVEHSTGYIRALVGGRNYADSNFNRILNMKRQVGSTFKPLVYLTALQKGYDSKGVAYGPGYPLEDSPWTLVYDKGRQKWNPKNYEENYLGWVSMRQALALSLNSSAARLGLEIGLDKIIETARLAGIDSPLPKVPALVLGAAELSPVELLRAYSTIANHGVQNELTVIRAITHNDGKGYARFVSRSDRVFPQPPIDLLIDMMQSVFKEGTAKDAQKLGFTSVAAAKTGTTNDHRDAWFAGFTTDITAVVWVGIDVPSTVNKAQTMKFTGAGSAMPIWINFVKHADERIGGDKFVLSSEILDGVRIDKFTGRPATSGCPDSQVLIEKYMLNQNLGAMSCEAVRPASLGNAEIVDF